MQNSDQDAYLAALEWHLDHGADDLMEHEPVKDRGKIQENLEVLQNKVEKAAERPILSPEIYPDQKSVETNTTQLKAQAKELANAANTLEELSKAIQDFDGLDVKKTATNLVFADGNSNADVMLIGEAPGADEDRQGKPFVGVSGQLLDKILKCVDLDRTSEDPEKSIYISNILNWRPPGNRTPTSQEMDIAKPFIEKHIALVNPKVLVFCGGVAGQTLLHTKDSISKLRGKTHEFIPQTLTLKEPVTAIATYHPAYLLRTPSQKSKVWQDMLFLKKHLASL